MYLLFILVYSINCYQCSGTDSNYPFECNEYLDSESGLEAIDCSLIHDAQYCIKHFGRFEGTTISLGYGVLTTLTKLITSF